MNAKERAIIEKRTIEATKKNIMGKEGKLGVIAQWLGSPIIRQGGGFMDHEYLIDPYDNRSEDEKMPVFDERSEFLDEEGWVFDGLQAGMHLEIKYNHYSTQLDCYYKGYCVYKEVAGDLLGYAPFPEWEGMVDRLYVVAKRKRDDAMQFEEVAMMEKVKRASQNFLQKLRMRWGI